MDRRLLVQSKHSLHKLLLPIHDDALKDNTLGGSEEKVRGVGFVAFHFIPSHRLDDVRGQFLHLTRFLAGGMQIVRLPALE